MHVEIISIDQSLTLDDSETRIYATLRLPDGQSVRIEILDDTASTLIAASRSNGSSGTSPWIDPGEKVESELVDWQELPDDVLSPILKTLFASSGLPTRLTTQELLEHVRRVTGVSNGASDFVEAAEKATTPTVVRNVSVPPAGRPPRRVAADEYGNPIVPRPAVLVQDGDEDGVASI